MASKRKTQRSPMFRVVRYNIEGREYADLSRDISEQGIFIKNFSPPPIGTPISLTVKLSEQWGGLPLRVQGRVVHINEDPDPHKRGMGVQFCSVQAESLPIIEYFVREVYGKDLEKSKLTQPKAQDEKEEELFSYDIDFGEEEN